MKFAFVETSDGPLVNRLLADCAAKLSAEGMRIAGAVPRIDAAPGAHPCEIGLKLLPEGPLLCISQNLGSGARGCRLDAASLEAAVAWVEDAFERQVDLLIVNRFGKQECLGRGFRPLIGEALLRGVPVLTAVNSKNRAGFDAFAAGMATALPTQAEALQHWVAGHHRRRGAA